MGFGRPKAGESRESDHTRLPRDMKRKLKAIARHRNVPIGDVIRDLAGDDIDREYEKLPASIRELSPEFGGES
jgi:tRNA(Arg) A34 adenosine deaminase TadA